MSNAYGYATPIFVGIEEASKILSVGRNTIYGLINAGKIRRVKIGRRTVLDRASIDEYAASL